MASALTDAVEATQRASRSASAWTRACFAFSGLMGVWWVMGMATGAFPPWWLSLGGLLVVTIGSAVSSHLYRRRMSEMIMLAKALRREAL